MENSELTHWGIKGMKWGVRRYQNKDGTLTAAGKERYYTESSLDIKTNSDGSRTVPKGFKFNRVGQDQIDINASGALYVSYGQKDASRYVKSLGPTLMGKLLGEYGTTVQHLSVREPIKIPNESTTNIELSKMLLENPKLLQKYNDSLYSLVYTGSFDKNVTKRDLDYIIDNPNSDSAKKMTYTISSFFGDPNFSKETSAIYSRFRELGYDALPDYHDIMSGTSETAMVIFNPEKIKMTSGIRITKETMKEAKEYLKQFEKLKVSEVLK